VSIAVVVGLLATVLIALVVLVTWFCTSRYYRWRMDEWQRYRPLSSRECNGWVGRTPGPATPERRKPFAS
jgi:hypothetical protein